MKTMKNLMLIIAAFCTTFQITAATVDQSLRDACYDFAKKSNNVADAVKTNPELAVLARKICCQYGNWEADNKNSAAAIGTCRGVTYGDSPNGQATPEVCSFLTQAEPVIQKSALIGSGSISKVLVDACKAKFTPIGSVGTPVATINKLPTRYVPVTVAKGVTLKRGLASDANVDKWGVTTFTDPTQLDPSSAGSSPLDVCPTTCTKYGPGFSWSQLWNLPAKSTALASCVCAQ